jgi:hypothetical protein
MLFAAIMYIGCSVPDVMRKWRKAYSAVVMSGGIAGSGPTSMQTGRRDSLPVCNSFIYAI